MNLESLSIKNLRSLTDPLIFPFCPLTLVVGANSSGKSTFLRSFPLLRQSVETITKGPILWFGRFVDFGVFKDVVARNGDKSEIEFGFSLFLPKKLAVPQMYYSYLNTQPYLVILDDCKVHVTLVIAEDPGTANTYTKQIRIALGERKIEITAHADGTVYSFNLDGQAMISSKADLTLRAGSSLFSMAVSTKKTTTKSTDEGADWPNFPQLGAFADQLFTHVGGLFHGSTTRSKIVQFIRKLGIGASSSLLDQVKRLARITPTSSERAESLKADSAWIKKLQGLVLIDRVPQLLNEIDVFLSATFKGVSYIGPLRATAERFYRQQDLAVDEVDPQGANLAMFLMGLSSSGQTAFSDWCQKNIGFSVEAKPVGAHVSINLKDSVGGGLFNVADMGFGYSQLLPVLATMWRASTAETNSTTQGLIGPQRKDGLSESLSSQPKIIAIEQPELHLHPRLQGRLSDLFASIVNESESSKTKVHLICETHSETIVNQIGKLIAKGTIKPEHVQVLVFEKIDDSSGSIVKKAEYDQDGVLLNWPYGFFLPSED